MPPRSAGRPRQALRRCRWRNCSGCAACLPASFLPAWRSTAIPASTAGSRRSAGAFAAAIRPCSSSWPRPPAAMRSSPIWNSCWSWRPSTSACTKCCSMPLPGAVGSVRERNICWQPPASSRPKAWIAAPSKACGGRPRRSRRARRGAASRRPACRRRVARPARSSRPVGRRSPSCRSRLCRWQRHRPTAAPPVPSPTRLAKLRSLFVIAQGTVFALSERRVGPEQAGRILNVDYIVSGSLRRQGDRLIVSVELAETRSARIVWAEVFDQTFDAAFRVLDEIGNRIVASIATEVESIERNRAILKPPNSLDAWEAHHRGLWHMYRFNKADNDLARHFFETAVRLDPTFARAYAGLSFTHFQTVFQGWAQRQPEMERAFEAAGQSLMADDRDPAAHWAMGRALWLYGRQDQSIIELERAIDLSPNFALGHYTLAFVHAQGGDANAAVSFSDQSRHLSPFDPMLFAMFGSRAVGLVRLQRFEEAAEWAVKAAARPNAHEHIRAVAAFCLALANRHDEARALVASIHRTRPNYRVDDFLAAFQFEPEAVALYRQGAKRLGLA